MKHPHTNVPLAAAAPELLEVLKEAVANTERYYQDEDSTPPGWLSDARLIIAKAEGR